VRIVAEHRVVRIRRKYLNLNKLNFVFIFFQIKKVLPFCFPLPQPLPQGEGRFYWSGKN